MPGPQPDDQGFLSLWPTSLLRRQLPGAGPANQALARLILDFDARHDQLTTDYLGGNLLATATSTAKIVDKTPQR